MHGLTRTLLYLLCSTTPTASALSWSADSTRSVTVTWAAGSGTITSHGLYTAPQAAGADWIQATTRDVMARATVTVTAVSAPTFPGVPFGLFHLEPAEFSTYPFSGALIVLYTATAADVEARLKAAKAAGYRVWVAWVGGRSNYVDANGFRLDLWKRMVDRLDTPQIQQVLRAYADSGTILGHYLLDEPNNSSGFNGGPPTTTELQEMACYSKKIFPYLTTAFRVVPEWLAAKSNSWPCLDAAWAQWEGLIHLPSSWTRSKTRILFLPPDSAKLTRAAQLFADSNAKAAKTIGLSLVLGFNTLDGGDGESEQRGTYSYAPGTARNRWTMSAQEIRLVGTTFVRHPDVCAVISWRHGKTLGGDIPHLAQLRAYDDREDVGTAYRVILDVAKEQPPRRCAKPQ